MSNRIMCAQALEKKILGQYYRELPKGAVEDRIAMSQDTQVYMDTKDASVAGSVENCLLYTSPSPRDA